MPRRGLALMGTVLLLAACGGGGGGGGGSTPSPAAAQGAFVLPANGNGNGATVIASAGKVPTVQNGSGTLAVIVGDGQGNWRATSATLGDVRVTESANGRAAVMTASSSSTSSSASGSFEHTQYGIWLESGSASVLAGSSREVTEVSAFVIGTPTPVGQMPTAGQASYRGNVLAVELAGDAQPRSLSGPLDATADFGTGRLTAVAELRGAADNVAFGQVRMEAMAIAGNSFAGSASSTRGHSGSAEGGFTGPNAVELGGTFELTGPSTVHGAFAAKRN